MSSIQERREFSERLKRALLNAHYYPNSPTKLAREFNLRFDGKPVTIHAVRKWLIGESIPTQDKIRCLATWLCVSSSWLRFDGDTGVENKLVEIIPATSNHFSSENLKLMADLENLDAIPRAIVREMVRVLLRIYSKHLINTV